VLRRVEHVARHGREHSQPRPHRAVRANGPVRAPCASARARRHPRPMWALKRGLAEPRPQLFQAAVRRLAHGGQPSLPMACDAWLCSRRAETEASSIPEWSVGQAGLVRRVSGRGGSYRRSRCFRPLVARPPSLLRVQCCTKPPEAELRVPVRRWSRCLLDSLGSQLTR